MPDLVPAEAIRPDTPGGPATDAGENREGPYAHAERAERAVNELVRELRHAGQGQEVLGELERIRATLHRICESLKGSTKQNLHQAVRGSQYNMADATNDLARDVRSR